MLALCWTLYSVALLVVIARVYTQQQITRQFGLGDYFMLSSIVGVSHSVWIEHITINSFKVFGLMHISFLTVSHRYGLGRHFFYLSDYLRVKAMEWEFIAEPFGEEALLADTTRVANVDQELSARCVVVYLSLFYYFNSCK